MPTSWLSLILFMILVAPGLVFDLLSERRRAGLADSAFREVARIMLASTAFSGGSVVILTLTNLLIGWPAIDPKFLIGNPTDYFANHYSLVAISVAVEVLIAVVLACIFHFTMLKFGDGAKIRPRSAWTQVFRTDCPPDHDVFVRVKTSSGSLYHGRVAEFTPQLDASGRELVLAPPLSARVTPGKMCALPKRYQRVVFRGDEIELMNVEYRPKLKDQGKGDFPTQHGVSS